MIQLHVIYETLQLNDRIITKSVKRFIFRYIDYNYLKRDKKRTIIERSKLFFVMIFICLL